MMIDLIRRSTMAQNKVQYQRGLSMPEFFNGYGSAGGQEFQTLSFSRLTPRRTAPD